MYRIRLHGRGGHGIKTAGRMLGSAFFAEGFEVQDAPRYGAERRGAPIFAYVRADRAPIAERGAIEHPDLVIVVDESLVQVPAAGVTQGVDDHVVLVIASDASAETWRERLALAGPILTLSPDPGDDAARSELMGAASVGAAARAIGVISLASVEAAVREELAALPGAVIERNVVQARESFERFADHEGCVVPAEPRAVSEAARPDWVRLAAEPVAQSAPGIHGAATSELVATGLWRTQRPEIDADLCRRCSWICSTLCPDGAIDVAADRRPVIDYDHCKGCLICVAVCPSHAIRVEPEPAPVPVRPRVGAVEVDGSAASSTNERPR